ncbi:MAG: ATP synthase F0 subunit B [Planctomycetes bacterium RBG_16_64_12]|nr:MAG: ATP synthase F0 subunit B [Planctomycetes bacterium RBG_16_64_12]
MFTRLARGVVVALVLFAGPLGGSPVRGQTGGHAAVGAEEAHGEVNINPLEFQKDLAIWTAVIFLVLMAVLWKFAWGPIARGLEKREQRIADEIASAERSNTEARQLLEEYHERLAATGQEVRQMLQAARRDAEQVGHEIVEKAKAESQAEHRRALGEIDLATAHALKELAERSATLAVELAGKIVRSELDPKAHSQLIEQAMADFVAKPDGNR